MVVHSADCTGTASTCPCLVHRPPTDVYNTVDLRARINLLLARRSFMDEYLLLKRDEADWHGVQDAASDLRDIEAELKGLRWVVGEEE